MASEDFPTDLNGEYIEHHHLLSSDQVEWERLALIYELEPAGEMPEAPVVNHTLVVCLGSFQGSFQVNGQWHHEEYASGDIVIIAAGELFPRVRVDRQVPLLELFLSPDVLVNGGGEIISPKTRLQSHWRVQDPLIQQMALALKTELELAEADSKLYADSMAVALGTHLLRRYAIQDLVIKEYRGGLAPYQLKLVVEYIHGHLAESLTLTMLADLIQISPHYFASLFKQSTGSSPHRYITQCRLAKAKKLLSQGNQAIAFIGQEVGFKNQSHFTRVFRQHFQITPQAYRNSF